MVLIETTKKDYFVISAGDMKKIVYDRVNRIRKLTDAGYKIKERDDELKSISLSKRGTPVITLIMCDGVASNIGLCKSK